MMRSARPQADRKFSCDQCDKRFFTRKDVKRHSIVHTGLRNYSCQRCHARFGRKDHLVRHAKKSCTSLLSVIPSVVTTTNTTAAVALNEVIGSTTVPSSHAFADSIHIRAQPHTTPMIDQPSLTNQHGVSLHHHHQGHASNPHHRLTMPPLSFDNGKSALTSNDNQSHARLQSVFNQRSTSTATPLTSNRRHYMLDVDHHHHHSGNCHTLDQQPCAQEDNHEVIDDILGQQQHQLSSSQLVVTSYANYDRAMHRPPSVPRNSSDNPSGRDNCCTPTANQSLTGKTAHRDQSPLISSSVGAMSPFVTATNSCLSTSPHLETPIKFEDTFVQSRHVKRMGILQRHHAAASIDMMPALESPSLELSPQSVSDTNSLTPPHQSLSQHHANNHCLITPGSSVELPLVLSPSPSSSCLTQSSPTVPVSICCRRSDQSEHHLVRTTSQQQFNGHSLPTIATDQHDPEVSLIPQIQSTYGCQSLATQLSNSEHNSPYIHPGNYYLYSSHQTHHHHLPYNHQFHDQYHHNIDDNHQYQYT